MYHGKHKLARLVRSLTGWQRVGAVTAMLTLAGGGAAYAAAGAGATSASTVITHNGESGYYANMNEPGHFTTVKGQFYVRQAAQGIGAATGGIGAQLGNDTTNAAVQIGFVWNPPACPGQGEIGYGVGALPTAAIAPGVNVTNINAGGRLPVTALAPVLCVPVGHYVKFNLTETSPGNWEAFAKDVTLNISASKAFTAGLTYPNNASVGVVADLSARSAPANIDLVRFAFLSLKDSHGVTGGFTSGSEWSVTGASSNPTGTTADPFLATPGPITSGGSVFKVFVGAHTGP